jgi:hypothetical protein
MPTPIPIPPPDQVLVLPPWRQRQAPERWVVRLWRQPAQASFSRYQGGRLVLEHSVAWSAAGWAEAFPVAAPGGLIARAHRCLRQLQRTAPTTTPAERLAAIQRQRRILRSTTTPALLKP